MSTASGGPAFPLPDSTALAYAQMSEDVLSVNMQPSDRAYYEAKLRAAGMTLRDYFAAHFMGRAQSLCEDRGTWNMQTAAQCAYAMADEMLEARK